MSQRMVSKTVFKRVFKLSKDDQAFWGSFARQMHCKDAPEFAEKLTVIMKTTPPVELREWIYSQQAKSEGQPDAPLGRIFSTIFQYAIKDQASEIHIVPQRGQEPAQGEVEGAPIEDFPHEVGPRPQRPRVAILYHVNDGLREQDSAPLHCGAVSGPDKEQGEPESLRTRCSPAGSHQC